MIGLDLDYAVDVAATAFAYRPKKGKFEVWSHSARGSASSPSRDRPDSTRQ